MAYANTGTQEYNPITEKQALLYLHIKTNPIMRGMKQSDGFKTVGK